MKKYFKIEIIIEKIPLEYFFYKNNTFPKYTLFLWTSTSIMSMELISECIKKLIELDISKINFKYRNIYQKHKSYLKNHNFI